jgi:probable rRNA maturation factor
MILNRQSAVRVSVPELERFLHRVRRKLRIPAGAVSVCFVTNAQMARWNRDFRKKNGPTDVLSFPAKDANADGTGRLSQTASRARKVAAARKNAFSLASATSSTSYLGDIAIAPAVARANARRCGHTLFQELRILILHGVIHLMGYDHETDHGEMDRFEQSVRRALKLEQP